MHRKIKLEDLLAGIKYVIDHRFTDKNLCIKTISQIFELDQMKKSKSLSKNIGIKFKEKYGYKISDRIHYLRIGLAKKLMHEENRSISAIANMCGFSNRIYFYRLFKETEKISPSEYRTKLYSKQ